MNRAVREMRISHLYETTRNWRAGCCKSSKSWFGEGRTEKVWEQNLAGRLLYNILKRYVHPETPLLVKRKKPPQTANKDPGAGSVPQPFGEEPASPSDCRNPRL